MFSPTTNLTSLMLAAVALVTCFAAGDARAEVKTQAVPYKHGDVELQGYLAYDDSVKGKRPGVLVVHEWYGLNDYAKSRAEQLARMGYVAFALDMYGKGVMAKSREEAAEMSGKVKADRPMMQARAKAGLEVLKSQKQVDPKKVAAIGYCFGGTTVLELARSGADLAGVVSFHGGLDTPSPAPAGKIKCKVLVCHGADDPFITDEHLLAFRNEMQTGKVDWTLIAYGNSVHGFTNPGNANVNAKGVGYNEDADRRSWADMRQFFGEIFGEDATAKR